jgi:hypothetical protein
MTVSDDERSYFHRRAEDEIEAAQAARHPEAVRAHYILAGFYLDLAFNPAVAGPLSASPGGVRAAAR